MSIRIAPLIAAADGARFGRCSVSGAAHTARQNRPGRRLGQIVLRLARSADERSLDRRKGRATELKQQLGDLAPKAIVVGEPTRANKARPKRSCRASARSSRPRSFGGRPTVVSANPGSPASTPSSSPPWAGRDVDIQPVCGREHAHRRTDAGEGRAAVGERLFRGGHGVGRQARAPRSEPAPAGHRRRPLAEERPAGCKAPVGPGARVSRTGGSVNKNAARALSTGKAKCCRNAVSA